MHPLDAYLVDCSPLLRIEAEVWGLDISDVHGEANSDFNSTSIADMNTTNRLPADLDCMQPICNQCMVQDSLLRQVSGEAIAPTRRNGTLQGSSFLQIVYEQLRLICQNFICGRSKKFDLEADFALSTRTEKRYFVSYKCFSLFVMSRFCLFRLKVPVQGRGASAHWRAIAGGRSHLSSCGCQVPITPAVVSGKGCNSVLDVQKKEDVAPSFPNGVRKMR